MVIGIRQGWYGLLLAFGLVLGTLAPTLDTFICIGDIESSSISASQEKQVQKVPASNNDGDTSCVHGHCHHWVGFAKFTERTSVDVSQRPSERIVMAYLAPASAPQNELLRPPQG